MYEATRDRMRAHQDEKAQQALVDLISATAVITATEPEHAEAEIAELLREAQPETEAALFEHFRASMEALEVAAQPHIARLTAIYLIERRVRDAFFRRVGRLLVDASADEVAQLHQIFACAREALGAEGLRADEGIAIAMTEGKGGGALVFDVKSRHVIRESGVKGARLDEGFAALHRSLLLPKQGASWQIDFEDHEDLLMRLIRVFA